MARVFHPVAQTSEAHVRYTIGGVPCENVYAYKWNNTTPPSEAELLSLANEVEGTIAFKTLNLQANTSRYVETYCRNIHTESAAQATANGSLAAIPRTGNLVAGNIGFWLTKRTGLTGRSHHGGANLSGFAANDVANNTLSAALLSLIINLALSIIAQRAGGRFIPAVASRHLAISNIITSVISRLNDVDSSKSRLPDPH